MDDHGAGSGGAETVGSERASTSFVGRDDELELLSMLLARAVREGSPQLVTVTGEPGIGKSRLVERFEATTDAGTTATRAGAEPPRWARGRALPPGEGAPLGALSDVVRSLSFAPADGDVLPRHVLERELRRVLTDQAEREWFLARLAPLLGGEGPDPGETTEAESFTAWRRFLEAEASRSPLVLAFEDLHHAGDRLLAFVEHVLDWSTAAPMLLLCTARPELYERSPGWGGGKRSSTTIALSPLPGDQAEVLVRMLFDAAGIGAEESGAAEMDRAVAVVVERSGGNPLYAEQFVRLLADRAATDAAVDDNRLVSVPESIRELIAARLGALPEEQRSVLSDASVLGPVFRQDALAEMDGADPGRIAESLRELARRDLVRPSRTSSPGGGQEYAFVHGLVRDVAYREIPPRDRLAKHRAAAAWLERAGAAERIPGFAEVLAHHDTESVQLGRALRLDPAAMAPIEDRAVRSLTRAGDQAVPVDVRRAQSLYGQALTILPAARPERADLLARAGEMASITGRFPEAANLLEEATTAFLEQGRRLEAARASLDLAYARWSQAGTTAAQQALDRAFDLLEGLPPSREHARAATDRAAWLFFTGDSAGALAATEEALRLANEVGAQDLAARLLEIRGMSRCDAGDQGGLADLHRALAGSRDLDLGPETVRAYLNLGAFATPMEGPAAALGYFTAGAELAERRGIVELGMWTKAWELGVLFELGAWDRLLVEGREVLAWDHARGGSQLRVAAMNCIAEVLAYRGRAGEAAEMANGFIAEARAVGDPQIVLPALAIAALARLEVGDAAGAVAALEGFAEIYPARAPWVGSLFTQVCARVGVGVGRLDLVDRLMAEPDRSTPRGRCVAESARGILAEAKGIKDEALAHHLAAADGWDAYGFGFEQAQSAMAAARCLHALGRPVEASSLAEGAARTFQDLGAAGLASAALALA